MKLLSIPANAYTNYPVQHPNIFVGSLQLLFWLMFRPSVWANYVRDLDPLLDKNFSLIHLLTFQRWQQKKIQRFLFQGFILLPMMTSLVSGFIVSDGDSRHFMLFFTAFIIFTGLIIGALFGVVFGVVFNGIVGISYGVAIGMMIGISFSVIFGVAFDLTGAVGISLVFGGIVGILSKQIYFSIIMGLITAIGLWVNWWRPLITLVLIIPWNSMLYRIDEIRAGHSPVFFMRHLAFWDECQYLPIWGLDKHLLLILERSPIEGQAALNYLSTSRQRWAAQSALIETDARQLGNCKDAYSISQIQQILTISELTSSTETMFRRFNSISVDVDVALRQSSIYNQRLALTAVAHQLNNFIRELTISSDEYAVRFRPIAQRWQNIIDLHLQDLIKESELRQETNSPYIIGVPVTNRQQLFVGRTDISEKLEKLLLDRRSPPLLLYGQRRTGKTSLLNNLGRLLPTSIIPLFIDLQGISSAKDHSGFLYSLAKAMINSAYHQRNIKLPPLSYEALIVDPFLRFNEWLDNIEVALAGNTALLALDEFEVLDRVLNEGRFNENDVLGMLRNLIQHRPKFKVLLAGSHTLNEFQRWSSYLINAQVLHLGYLQESEARQLIETPIENFALRYEPPASQRVIDITKGHPFLIQLLCAEIVALKNDQDPSIRRLATLADVEAAIPEALEHGSMFFSDIQCNQLDGTALAVLRHCAQQGEGAIISKLALAQQFSVGLAESIDLLLRRELLETQPAGYCIQLELIRRWFDRP